MCTKYIRSLVPPLFPSYSLAQLNQRLESIPLIRQWSTTLLPHRAKRFECAAPVAFWWPRSNGVVQSGVGVTRNIGNSGVLIATTECPRTGTPVQLTVYLPRPEGIGYAMKLGGEGIVVRVESERSGLSQQATGFAASVQFYLEPMETSELPISGGNGTEIDTALSAVLQGARRNGL